MFPTNSSYTGGMAAQWGEKGVCGQGEPAKEGYMLLFHDGE